MTINGSCLCQAVKYRLSNEKLHQVTNCHCPNCRKTHGAAFGTYVPVQEGDFRWTRGEDLVSRFESSPNTYRCFCRVCGSPLAAFDGSNIRCITLGTVDGDPGLRPESHIYVSARAPWYEITDGLTQYDLRGPDTKPPAPPVKFIFRRLFG